MVSRNIALRGWMVAGCGVAALTLAACDNGGTVANPPEAAKTQISTATPAAAPAELPAATPAPVVDPSQVVTATTPIAPLPHYDIHFVIGSARLSSGARATLHRTVTYLHDNPTVQVKLSGYTDRSGPASINQELAEKRARTAASFLEQNGVDQSRIEIVAMGETAETDVPAGVNRGRWSRRVDIDFMASPSS
jgi:outer membrane protein OmpA-like peptidoglycan-associated protein